jgi:hypothetical protein
MPDLSQADPTTGYSPHEHRPLASYSVLTAIFGTAFTGGLIAAHRHRGELPASYSALDVVTVGVATHKLSRLITKDKVTAFVRAPFTRFQDTAGHGELDEEPRGDGLRYAVGELLVCPYCIAQWVVGAFGVGMVAAPRLTRLIAFMYTAEGASDFLQLAYLRAEKAADS